MTVTPIQPPERPLRLAILEADLPLPNTAAKYGGYGGVFNRLLSRACASLDLPFERTLEIKSYPVWSANVFPKLDDIDAVLITGSKFNAFDKLAWIERLVDFTREALHCDRVKVVGICFGHQIAARALGGVVERNDKGWEVAVTKVDLSEEGQKVFGREALDIYQMHRDIVPAMPPPLDGKEIHNLGSTNVCSIQGMYIPGRFISLQGHPEFDKDLITEIVTARKDAGIFTEEEYKDYMSRLHVDDGVEIGARIVRFLLEE